MNFVAWAFAALQRASSIGTHSSRLASASSSPGTRSSVGGASKSAMASFAAISLTLTQVVMRSQKVSLQCEPHRRYSSAHAAISTGSSLATTSMSSASLTRSAALASSSWNCSSSALERVNLRTPPSGCGHLGWTTMIV
ncbi:hypothetical protein D3C71_1391770 [compost metagenome]